MQRQQEKTMKTKKELGFRWLAENRPARRDSKFSKLRNRLFNPLAPKNSPAQRHSKFSKLAVRLTSPISPSCLPEQKTSHAQRYSKFSKLGICPMGLMGPIGKENQPVERHSKFSKSRNRLFCPLTPKNTPVQRHSKFSKSGMCPMRPIGHIRLNQPVERHSKFSKLVLPLCLAGCQASPDMRDVAVTKRLSVQQDSNISKLHKNQPLHFLHGLHGEEMLSAQPYSNISNFGICCSTRPSRTVDSGTCPRRARGTTPRTVFESSPARWHSKNSKWGIAVGFT